MSHHPHQQKRAGIYTVDFQPGMHAFAYVEGVGECREPFMRLTNDLESGTFDVVVVYKAEYLFVDTSPLWMEKFIRTVKRNGIIISDATSGRAYDLRDAHDEDAFLALGKH